jgi:two-component system sensor histidine kinase DesK
MARFLFQAAPDSLAEHYTANARSRWLMGFNLMWSLWVFGDPLFGSPIGSVWLPATVASFPVFLLLYVLVHVRPKREMPWLALALAVLGWLTMPFNHAGGTSYLIFSCAYLAFAGGVRQAFAAIFSVIALFVLEGVLLGWPWLVIAMMSAISFCVGAGNIAFRLNWLRQADLRLSHEEVRRLAAMAERERIGRDLHDLLGHTLSLITLKVELARKLLDRDPDAARRELSETEKVARHALAEVRGAVTGIRATDMAAELASARLLLESSSVAMAYELPPPLPPALEKPLALVLREAATNIARHARATSAIVSFGIEGTHLRMRIADDGRGGIAADGNGVTGMRERVHALHGTLELSSARTGTILDVLVPLSQPSPAGGGPSPLPADAHA